MMYVQNNNAVMQDKRWDRMYCKARSALHAAGKGAWSGGFPEVTARNYSSSAEHSSTTHCNGSRTCTGVFWTHRHLHHMVLHQSSCAYTAAWSCIIEHGSCSAQQARKRTPIPAPGQQQPAAAKPVAAAAAAKPAAAPARQAVEAPPKVRAPVGKQQPASRGATSSTPKAAAAKANDGLGANSAEVHPDGE